MSDFLKPWNRKTMQNDTPFECEVYLTNMIKDYMEPMYHKYLMDNVFNHPTFDNCRSEIEIGIVYSITDLVMNPEKFNSAQIKISIPIYMDTLSIKNMDMFKIVFVISSNKELARKSLKVKEIGLDIFLNDEAEFDGFTCSKYLDCYFYRAPNTEKGKYINQLFKDFSDIHIPYLCDQWIFDCKTFLQLDIEDRMYFDYDYFEGIIKKEAQKK